MDTSTSARRGSFWHADWPWPRDVHAALIDRPAAAGDRTIVHAPFFFEPQSDRGRTVVQQPAAIGAGAPGYDAAASGSEGAQTALAATGGFRPRPPRRGGTGDLEPSPGKI